MIYGLKLKFRKSHIFGTHIKSSLMNATSSFPSCKIGSLSFKFLGVNVGDSPRTVDMLYEIIENVKRRLSSWKSRHLSMGGRLVMINSVLNSMPLYTISFYKAPCKVINQINDIQSRFLWGGSEIKNKVHWVSWENVCVAKQNGA